MAIEIDPKNDFAFRKCFSSPENKLALIGLLNSILNLQAPIIDVAIENPFNLKEIEADKETIVDLRVTDQIGRTFIVEMQFAASPFLPKRLFFYGCESYERQLLTGDSYSKLKPVYVICLTPNLIWHDFPLGLRSITFKDQWGHEVTSELIEVHVVELGKYNTGVNELKSATKLEKWAFWFNHASEFELDELLRILPDSAISQASRALHNISIIAEDRLMYDASVKARRDRLYLVETGFEQGIAQGIEQGLEQGLEQGRKDGEIKLIHVFEEILNLPLTDSPELNQRSLSDLQIYSSKLRDLIEKTNKQ